MAPYQRADSKYWQLYLETTHEKRPTKILIGTTVTERRDNAALAQQLYHRLMGELSAQVHHLPIARAAIRFTAYAAIYETDTIPHNKGHEREREMLKTLRGAFADELLSALDRDRVKQYMTARRDAGVKAVTVNREVDLLKSMLRDAVPKYLEASPIVGMKRLKIVKPKRRLMTPTEERKLLAELGPVDRAIVIMGLDTLCRLGDILDLRREDDGGKNLYIADPKDPDQGEPYTVPVSKRLRKALDAVYKDQGDAAAVWVFAKRRIAKTDRDRRNTIRQVLEYACARADIPYGRKNNGITFHWATRRTAATRLAQRGVKMPTLMELGHWKSAEMVLGIYTEAASGAARKAVELVSQAPRRKRRSA